MNDFSEFYKARLKMLSDAFAHQHYETSCDKCQSRLNAIKELFNAFKPFYNGLTKDARLENHHEERIPYELDPLIKYYYEKLSNHMKEKFVSDIEFYNSYCAKISEETGINKYIIKDFFEYREKLVKIS